MNTFLGKNVFFRFMSKAAYLVFLSLLWLLCSLPIFTLGAATTALHTVTLKMVCDEEGSIIATFYQAFRRNFRQSTILWGIALAWLALIWIDWNYLINFTGPIRYLGGGIFAMLLFGGLLSIMALFPIQAYFDNSVHLTLLIAIRMALGHLPQAFALLVLTAVMLYACYTSAGLLCAFIVLGAGFHSYISSLLWRRTFSAYTPSAKIHIIE